jgi:hypothetical protein
MPLMTHILSKYCNGSMASLTSARLRKGLNTVAGGGGGKDIYIFPMQLPHLNSEREPAPPSAEGIPLHPLLPLSLFYPSYTWPSAFSNHRMGFF